MVEKIQWNKIKDIALEMYQKSSEITPYQSNEYFEIKKKGFLPRLPFKALLSKEITYIVKNQNNKITAIAPLLIFGNSIYAKGAFTGAGHVGIIYSDEFLYDDWRDLILQICKDYPQKRICFERVSMKTRIPEYMKSMFKVEIENLSKDVCVSIPLPSLYDDWYGMLSKSVRQNLRTSYNRLSTDNACLRIETEFCSQIKQTQFNDMLFLFSKRASEYKHLNGDVFFPLLKLLKKMDPMIHFIKNSKNTCWSIVYINEKPAACCAGYISNDGRLIVPRLSIDTRFGRYSPGGILINELIKKICSDDSIKISELDLSRGEEKYKYNFGGIEHYNISCDILLKEIKTE